MTLLDPRSAYRLWASSYSPENAISAVDDRVVRDLTPPLVGKRLLDAGCGTGRRLMHSNAAVAIGLDLSAEMLAVARRTCPAEVRLLEGDVRSIPLDDASQDVSWCRLVIGHLPECATAYHELARVTAPGGRIVVTDFHPAAYAAGHRRTFRIGGDVHEVEHHLHLVEDHLAAAETAGLDLVEIVQATIGRGERRFYEAAGRIALFDAHHGLRVVLGLAFRRPDRCAC